MTIGVVIPTYNRVDNLLLALKALANQTNQDFHLIIADDGSTDNTRQQIIELTKTSIWQGRLHWVGCGLHQGFRAGRARNIGEANLPLECDFICFLDSDVLLNEQGIEYYAQAYAQNQNGMVMGLIDWLPALSQTEMIDAMKAGDLNKLRKTLPSGLGKRIEGTYIGSDLRAYKEPHTFKHTFDYLQVRAEMTWTTNIGCPRHLFRELGGFDEAISGYGGEDIEFGFRAQNISTPCLYYRNVWALHIWHPKNNPEQLLTSNKKNLEYVLRKHGPHRFVEDAIDLLSQGQ